METGPSALIAAHDFGVHILLPTVQMGRDEGGTQRANYGAHMRCGFRGWRACEVKWHSEPRR